MNRDNSRKFWSRLIHAAIIRNVGYNSKKLAQNIARTLAIWTRVQSISIAMGSEITTSLAKLSSMAAKQLFLMWGCSVLQVVVAPVSSPFSVVIGLDSFFC